MNNSENQFDFEHYDFPEIRKGIFEAVKELIGNNIQIVNIRHIQYQESYSFREGDTFADIRIYFKAKGLISDIKDTSKPITTFGELLLKVLSPLKGGQIDVEKSLDLNELDKLSKQFTSFVKKIKENLQQKNIRTELIEISDYKFTLSFSLQLKKCIYIFHFNKYFQNLQIEARNKVKNSDLIDIVNASIKECFASINDNNIEKSSEETKIKDEEDPFAY